VSWVIAYGPMSLPHVREYFPDPDFGATMGE